jgi:hypothetical protein
LFGFPFPSPPSLPQTFREVKNENFDLKLRIFFLEEKLEKMSPQQMNGMAQEVCQTIYSAVIDVDSKTKKKD